VLVCDLDNFKQINDRFGHIAGNKVLRAVGAALRDSCREYDYVARMGGDEFVLVLPASDCATMKRRIGELREIGARAGNVVAGMSGLTVSIGEAFFPADGSDAEQLLAEADRRMYFAKRAARAKCIPAPLTAETPCLVGVQ
jgi:diguanylate cyclase (GGDEF)-like protein